MASFNSNISALKAERQLGLHTRSLGRIYDRLSSGLRIVRASDDAAGLAIASDLNASARVFSQGIRNINDGISYLAVAEGSLTELKSILFRGKELAEQSANGTLGNSQRNALEAELQALVEEYNRILSSTSFNNRRTFESENAELTIQFGFQEAGSITATVGIPSTSEDSPTSVGTAMASLDSGGGPANDGSGSPLISSDGRYISFHSSASDHVAGDTNGAGDIFVRGTETGVTTRASLGVGGVEANGEATGLAMSANGRYVAFSSTATNLVAGDTNGLGDVFVRDLRTGTTTRVSITSAGGEPNATTMVRAISSDGRYVLMYSEATNMTAGDVNGASDVFIRDTLLGVTTLVSVDSSGIQGNDESTALDISEDGRYVLMRSFATNLVVGDTNGQGDLFLHDRNIGTTTRVNVSSAGVQADTGTAWGRLSANGRYVVFDTPATNLVAGDTNANNDVFVHGTQTGETQRVSLTSSGAEGNGVSLQGRISGDGRYVAFYSVASNLVTGDTNGFPDVFVADRTTGAITRVSTSAAGDEANHVSDFPVISADGSTIAYTSFASNLVPGDSNGDYDIFFATNTLIASSLGFTASVTPLTGVSVATQSAALAALSTLDNYFAELQQVGGAIGASTNRLGAALSTTRIRVEGFTEAASQILDVDIAQEAANLTRTSILQQFATAVLSQTRLSTELALDLLS